MDSREHAEACCLHEVALEAFPHPIIIHDQRVIYMNSAARKALRVDSLDDVVGEPIARFVHPDAREAGEVRRQMLLEKGGSISSLSVKLLSLQGSVLYAICDACRIELEGRPAIMVTGRVTGERFDAARA